MRFSREELLDTISSISYVSNLRDFNFDKNLVSFNIAFDFEGLNEEITFEVTINSQYPFKFSGSETISFNNLDLIEYSHVMSNGSVCFHNEHCIDFRQKLMQDFNAIKCWITKYIIKEETDSHYEHLIVDNSKFDSSFYSYQFTNIEEGFKKGEFGTVSIKLLSNSNYNQYTINNHLVQSFNDSAQPTIKDCDWSNYYLKASSSEQGIYIFLEEAPAVNQRFSFNNWSQFNGKFSQDFLSYLWKYIFLNSSSFDTSKPLPIFIGFDTANNEAHWQVALVSIDEVFFESKINIENQEQYILKDTVINWAITNNSSYSYFFGRGAFSEVLTNSKILIIGVGAVGSNVSKTLVRCGCKNIFLVDYDIKEPENICRSEYEFMYPYNNKVDELCDLLYRISPFVEVRATRSLITEHLKSEPYAKLLSNKLEKELSNYDYIFDCSTDDDLMHILDSLNITANIINLSVTNHAQSLVCGISPNTYKFVRHQFDSILENDVEDLYNPIGCWSPTFRASYNDISTLVQFALKQINNMTDNHELRNFVINYHDNGECLKVSKF
ncbi:ThiF family adenylyltransferase [Psychrobacter sp. TAE2020]|uniref:ThiF family adenylyltransferase n=1 Tax=Psychrobacter sp. TAE2020 TaxID=2846762 RepID=UPI001C0FACBC|nr:ThiF family adenylyltransferase [Psychrobacter sp. TAE2020]MBU5615990.1 ThiF family adenylyltransferase [Psychrobacter sp. TAE2020]